MQTELLHCLTSGVISVSHNESTAVYSKLIMCGVLVELEQGQIQLTTPAAASYINHLIFPQRAAVQIHKVRERGIYTHMKTVLAHLVGRVVVQCLVPSCTDGSLEVAFQNAMIIALHATTPAECFICPELSKYFPLSYSQVLEIKEGVAGPAVVNREGVDSSTVVNKEVYEEGVDSSTVVNKEVHGRYKYYLGSGVQWVIEIIISGNIVEERLSRLETHGEYKGLPYTDYIVVDFRMNTSVEAMNVQRNKHLMSVFFSQDDCSYCDVLYGLTEPMARTQLAC